MKIVSKNDNNGKVVYSSDIIDAIIESALYSVEGVAKLPATNSKVNRKYRKGIRVDSVGDNIYIDVFVKVYYNVSVRDVSYRIQQNIKDTLESMTDFNIKDVNVHVIDVELDLPVSVGQ